MSLRRLIEKDLFSGSVAGSAFTSEVIDLFGKAGPAQSLSLQASYVVSAPTGATVALQVSNDGTTWTDYQTATAITENGSVMILIPVVTFRYVRAVKAISGGTVALKGSLLAIGKPL